MLSLLNKMRKDYQEMIKKGKLPISKTPDSEGLGNQDNHHIYIIL